MKGLGLLLLAAAASLTACAPSPIIRAAAEGNNGEVTAQLAQGASIEDRNLNGCGVYPPNAFRVGNETPLICAVINGRVDTVKLLLAKGADVNGKDYLGNTALTYATGASRNEVIAALLRAKLEGRPLDSAAAPAPQAAAPAPDPQPAAQKQWYDK